MSHASFCVSARRVLPVLVAAILAAGVVATGPIAGLTPVEPANAAGSFADANFREFTVFSGLSKPVSVRFASDGRAFVAEKSGLVKAYDSITDTTATTVIDLRADVNSYWDRGILGIAIDPDFLGARPYLYVYYVYDAPLDQTAPVWNDACAAPPTGPGGTTDGCPVSSRLDRFTIDRSTNVAVDGSRTQLVRDWCQQFPSHAGGGIAFGADGQLYVTGGDGASFNLADRGQKGGTVPDYVNPYVKLNPCDDPVTVTSAPGTAPTIDTKTAQGGSFRSQDLRTTSDPVGLAGSIIRIDPDTGAASSGNPLSSSSSANARRIVAHGFRNPYRITFRPGTSDLYVAEVGSFDWEEVDRVPVPSSARTPTTMPNYGWPCYEGKPRSGFQNLNTDMCNSLYSAPSGTVTNPLFQYSHKTSLGSTGPCFVPDANGSMGAATTGLAFYTGPSGAAAAYPSKFSGALFFVDYSRDCLAAILPGSGGVPDPATWQQVASGVSNPVDLIRGPGGDLYYVDLDGGRVVRIRYVIAPKAVATATPDMAQAPVTVRLDGSGSSDPDPGFALVAWRWDLDNDGQYDDATGSIHDWAISTPAVYPVSLEVESSNGLKDTVDIVVDATNDPPVPAISSPSSSVTWAVGDSIAFSGSATDKQDGSLGPAALTWDLVMLHCPADCHEHVVESFSGASGSFNAPDHEYPSHLELRLFATDSHGTTSRAAVELMPKTTTLGLSSTPPGITMAVSGAPAKTPASLTVILKGETTVSAPLTATVSGTRYRFGSWADAGERVRDVTFNGPVALAATYVPDAPDTCSTAASKSTGTWYSERATGNGDVDWFKFSIGSRRRVVITAGDLPVNARLDLYSACSTRLTGSDKSGTRYEEITRVLAAGTYRVKVSFPTGAASDAPYVLKFRPMASGMTVKSKRVTAGAGGGGSIRIVGEVLNNTGRTRGRATVKATFKDGSGKVVATLSAKAFARRLGDGGVTPFAIAGSVPRYASISYSVTTGSVPASRPLTLMSLTSTANPDGSVTETGRVKNTGTSTASSVAVARTWYGRRGEVLDRGTATVSPSTLAPGKSGTFTIWRPVLSNVQGTRSQLRAS